MKTETIKAIQSHLKDLERFQKTLFEAGHNFWHCDAVDGEHKRPFHYYQRNKHVNMSTCGTCSDLMENRLKIRKLQRQLGIEQIPLKTNIKEVEHIKRMYVKNASECNPNYSYI